MPLFKSCFELQKPEGNEYQLIHLHSNSVIFVLVFVMWSNQSQSRCNYRKVVYIQGFSGDEVSCYSLNAIKAQEQL